MDSRFNAVLNSINLLEYIPELRVLDIVYTPATISDTLFEFGNKSGGILTDRKFNGAKVGIEVEIHEYDPVVRNTACQKLLSWASRGGRLETSDRPNQYLMVLCTNAPGIASALRWTDKVTVEFTASEKPFWTESVPQTLTITTSGKFSVGGCVDTAPVKATISSGNATNTGVAFTSLTVTCADTSITLSGINVAKNKRILIDYDEYGFLTIKTSDGTDLMQYRTGSDELRLPCGKKSNVKVTSNTAVTCVLEVSGYWL